MAKSLGFKLCCSLQAASWPCSEEDLMEIVFNLQNISLRLGVTKFPMFEQIAMKHRTSTIFKATLATLWPRPSVSGNSEVQGPRSYRIL